MNHHLMLPLHHSYMPLHLYNHIQDQLDTLNHHKHKNHPNILQFLLPHHKRRNHQQQHHHHIHLHNQHLQYNHHYNQNYLMHTHMNHHLMLPLHHSYMPPHLCNHIQVVNSHIQEFHQEFQN